MKIHEYQARNLLEQAGIPTLPGDVATTPSEARKIAERFTGQVVVKAQIHAGGRGKAGGVKVVSTPDEAGVAAASMLGRRLVTHQTPSGGVLVRKVLVAAAADIADELYVAVVMDGDLGVPVVMASTEGGVEIEHVAETTPEKIMRVPGDPLIGFSPYRARDMAYALGVPAELVRPTADLIVKLYRLFVDKDCSLVEVNPLVVTRPSKPGEVARIIALDAKVTLEDDALFRHPELQALHDPDQEEPLELRAAAAELSYVKLEGGRVGCMVNGAGLAMATMDITKWAGADPANFLDVGGSADEKRVEEAYRILVDDKDVEVILINLFGGILRCDAAARGIVAGAKATRHDLPIIVAMRGTNADEGLKILGDSGLKVSTAADLAGAAEGLKTILASMPAKGAHHAQGGGR
ncbi:MAG: ADP-forming succinate--CoA ligase subunit beta [Dehalococcoidia bacterium]|nr:ADP-forming succinate--CoA ligase subunit beta [Dehalococcoidia bacterium]MSQ35058.1 ADP-forming succinate--CoA ligase subunit beta [Dehalococcoidia bacterium]